MSLSVYTHEGTYEGTHEGTCTREGKVFAGGYTSWHSIVHTIDQPMVTYCRGADIVEKVNN